MQVSASTPAHKVVFVGPVGTGVAHGDGATALMRQALANDANVNLRSLPGGDMLTPDALVGVRSLLRSGEDAYMQFKFAPAAASLAEAAGQLTAIIGQLGPDELQLLQRARLLEGAAWAEAHHNDLAMRAFGELIVIMPGTAADTSLLSPKTQGLWSTAQAHVRSRGAGTLRVTSTPVGALVYLDGQSRGEAPVTLTELPVGTHYLTVRSPGYTTFSQAVSITASRQQQEVTLQETSAARATRRVAVAQRTGRGDISDDIALLEETSGANEAVVAAQVPPNLVFTHWVGRDLRDTVVYTEVRDLEAVERWTPRAVQALFNSRNSPAYFPHPPDPNVPARPPEPTVAADNDAGHGPSSYLNLWLGLGNGAISGFSPEYRLQMGGGWNVARSTAVDLQLEGAHSAYKSIASLEFVGATLAVRGVLELGQFALSLGGSLGGEIALQHGSSISLTAQFVPVVGAVGRVDFLVSSNVFVGLQGDFRVAFLRTVNAADATSATWPLRGYGLVGVGLHL